MNTKPTEHLPASPPLPAPTCCAASIEAIRSEARNQMSYAAQQFQLRYERIAFQAAALAVKLWEDADRLQHNDQGQARRDNQ